MGVFSYHHRDRRGVKRGVLSDRRIRGMFEDKLDRARLHFEVVKTMPRVCRGAGRALAWIRMIGLVGIAGLVVFAIAIGGGGGVLGSVLGALIVLLLGSHLLLFPVYEYAYGPTQARVLERFGYCVHCGYRLRGLPVSEDGLTACPECASVWRVERDGLDDVRVSSCENCGYDLAGLESEASGLTVCPECSAMWRVGQ